MKCTCVVASLFLAVQSSHAQAFVDILPGTNNVPIVSVNYTVNGNTVVQSNEASAVTSQSDGSVFLNSLQVNTGSENKTLNFFNDLGGVVTNLNISPSASGVGVFDNGTVTQVADTSAFQTSLAGITQDTDLLNFSFYDGTSGLPDSNTSDYDLLFARGFLDEDYILVSERNGNTYFNIVPLDQNGNVIAGANSLRFGGPATLGSHQAYDWRSGYATSDYFEDQDFGYSVASIEKFFEGTSVAPETVVYGFRIDNNGDADVKFFGLSSNPFTDNPINPNPLVPEPGTALLSVLAAVTLLRRRR